MTITNHQKQLKKLASINLEEETQRLLLAGIKREYEIPQSHKKFLEKPIRLYNSGNGVRVFKLIEVGPRRYRLTTSKKRIAYRWLTVLVKHWCDHEAYEGRRIIFRLPERVWVRIITLSKILKEDSRYSQGSYICILGALGFINYIAFMNQKQFLCLRDSFYDNNNSTIKNSNIGWFNKINSVDHKTFNKYYQGDEKQ